MLVLVFVHIVLSAGCARAAPAGFWLAYKPQFITQKFSDQGPWGGTRWITWVAPTRGTFLLADVQEFAATRGWSCGGPTKYSEAQLRQWQLDGQPVFPLHFGPGDRVPNDEAVKTFPRSIGEDSVIVACKTGWIRVDPATGESPDALGYIQIEQSGTRMAIYHLWGEI